MAALLSPAAALCSIPHPNAALTAAATVPRIADESLSRGKSVVTANKAMLALHGPRLAQLAEDNNATIGA